MMSRTNDKPINLASIYDQAYREAYSKNDEKEERSKPRQWVGKLAPLASLAAIPATSMGSNFTSSLYARTPFMKDLTKRVIDAQFEPEWSDKPTPEMQDVIDQFKRTHGVDVPLYPENARVGPAIVGPAFSPYKSEFAKSLGMKYGVSTPLKDPYILAHELGHATDAKRLGKYVFRDRISRSALSLGGLVAGSAMMGSEKYNQYAPAVLAGGTGAAMLVPEITANLNALRPMYKLGGMRNVARFGKLAVPAMGSYAMAPLGIYGGAKALQKLVWQDKKGSKRR